MPNVLADTIFNIRARLYMRCIVTVMFLAGYSLLYAVGGWKLVAGVALVNIAGDIKKSNPMLIHTNTGKTIDTDKLPDVLAAVYEKLDEIHTFFTSLQVPYFLRFMHAGKGSGCQSNLDPNMTPQETTSCMVAQCIMFIERSMPGVQVRLVVEDDTGLPREDAA